MWVLIIVRHPTGHTLLVTTHWSHFTGHTPLVTPLTCEGHTAVFVQAGAADASRGHLTLKTTITKLRASLHIQSTVPATNHPARHNTSRQALALQPQHSSGRSNQALATSPSLCFACYLLHPVDSPSSSLNRSPACSQQPKPHLENASQADSV